MYQLCITMVLSETNKKDSFIVTLSMARYQTWLTHLAEHPGLSSKERRGSSFFNRNIRAPHLTSQISIWKDMFNCLRTKSIILV